MYQNLTHKDVVARKEHRCDWCGETIKKGEKYHYETFVFEGKVYDWHSHLSCSRVVSAIWDYVDPDYGMSEDDFQQGCADVCRDFICPDCSEWNKEYEECEKDESYCIDKMDEFFKTHELYPTRKDYWRIWRVREKTRDCERR